MTIDFGAAQYEVGEGFPWIEGWHLDPHLELSFWDSSLHFQRGDKETRQWERLHVILLEGRLRSADVDLRPKRLMGGLLHFESGSLGFSFLRAFHIRQILQLGPPPAWDAWKIDVMRKQEERDGQPKEEEPQPVPPPNYRGWTIFGLEIVQSARTLLSFTLMAFGAAAEGRPGWATLTFLGPTRVTFSRFNYLHQGLLSRIEEISLRQIVPGRTAYRISFVGESFIEIEARGCAAIES
jgi:hypothetical protein